MVNRWLYHSITPELNQKPQPVSHCFCSDHRSQCDQGSGGAGTQSRTEHDETTVCCIISSGTGLLHSWLSLIWRSIVNFSITNKMIPADCNQRYLILNCPLINIQTLASTWPPDCSICNLMKMIMWSRTRLNFKKIWRHISSTWTICTFSSIYVKGSQTIGFHFYTKLDLDLSTCRLALSKFDLSLTFVDMKLVDNE